ncbi:hypothetical protein ACLBXO_26735 [Methylobacterium sp. C33D]
MTSRTLFRVSLAAACAVVATFGGEAFAQNADEMARMRANCGTDYMRFCAGMSPGGPEVRACFRRNRAKLSDGCSQAINDFEAHQAATPAAH